MSFRGYWTCRLDGEQFEVFTNKQYVLHYWVYMRPIGTNKRIKSCYDPGADLIRQTYQQPYDITYRLVKRKVDAFDEPDEIVRTGVPPKERWRSKLESPPLPEYYVWLEEIHEAPND